MLKLTITVDANTFAYKTSTATSLTEVLPLIERWFTEIEKPDRIALQTARLDAARDALRTAVDANTPTPST